VIFTSDPRERLRHRPASDRNGGRLRLGTTAGFKSESPAGFVGIRTQFAPQQMMVGVATDSKTGRKFNVVKLKNGKMMAISPITGMQGMPEMAQDDMVQ
jgi:hypothetical protein